MRVNPYFMPVIVIVALLGTVFAAQAAGFWSTSSRTTANLTQMTPADLKGWMTLQQVMDGLTISQGDLYALAGLPDSMPTTTALKDLEVLVPGFETTALRDALIAQLSVPGPATPIPASGSPTTLGADAVNTPVPLTHTATPGNGDTAAPTAQAAGQILPADQIKGKMTLREVSVQCAVPFDTLLNALSLPADTNPDALIKDLVAQGKLAEVATIQEAASVLQKK